MVLRPPRDPRRQRSTAATQWAAYRRLHLRRASHYVRLASQAVEWIPADEESARMMRVLYRLSARLLTDSEAT
jgi:hypothetical protein